MKSLLTTLLLAWVSMPAAAADVASGTLVESHVSHPFDVSDLVMMGRVSADVS